MHLHNTKRAGLANGEEKGRFGQPAAANMMQMVWDDELERGAQANADKCQMVHDRFRHSKFGNSGQNLAWAGSTQQPTGDISMHVQQWWDEIKDMGGMTVFSQGGRTIGHATQMMWAESWALGCGLTVYKEGQWIKEYVVCNYGPSGNWIGRKIYIPGPAASQCPRNTEPSTEYPGLCKGSPDGPGKNNGNNPSGNDRPSGHGRPKPFESSDSFDHDFDNDPFDDHGMTNNWPNSKPFGSAMPSGLSDDYGATNNRPNFKPFPQARPSGLSDGHRNNRKRPNSKPFSPARPFNGSFGEESGFNGNRGNQDKVTIIHQHIHHHQHFHNYNLESRERETEKKRSRKNDNRDPVGDDNFGNSNGNNFEELFKKFGNSGFG